MKSSHVARLGPTQVAALVITGFVLLLFLQVRLNDFVNWDDQQNFARNAFLRLPWRNMLVDAWHRDPLGNFHPLSWYLLWLQAAVGRLAPWPFHWTSLVLHCVNSLLLFQITLSLVRFQQHQEELTWSQLVYCSLSTLLFAVHPLRVEVVAWASCQAYLWAGLFAELSVLAYLRSFKLSAASRNRMLGISLALFSAAVLCRTIVVSLPLLLLLIAIYIRKICNKESVPLSTIIADNKRVAIGYCAVAAAVGSLAIRARHFMPPDWDAVQGSRLAHSLRPLLFLGNAVGRTLWPTGIHPFYPLPNLGETVLVASAALLGLAACIPTLRRSPGALLAVLAGLTLLVPGLVAALSENVLFADRYTYLPAMALSVGLALGLCSLGELAFTHVLTGLVVLIGFFSIGTRSRIAIWGDSETLWIEAIRAGGTDHARFYVNLGSAFLDKQKYEEAEKNLRIALEKSPKIPESHDSLGVALSMMGRQGEAEEEFKAALALKPAYPDALNNLAFALSQEGKNDLALESVNQGLQLEPGEARMHENRASILENLGRLKEAQTDWEFIVASNPSDSQSRIRLGVILGRLGDNARAGQEFLIATRLAPYSPSAHYNLGLAKKALGNLEGAKDSFLKAAEADPNFIPAITALKEFATVKNMPEQ